MVEPDAAGSQKAIFRNSPVVEPDTAEAQKAAPRGSPVVEPDAAGSQKTHALDTAFARSSLGYSSDNIDHIETAGAGRLTIVGFVPSPARHRKSSWLFALAALMALGGVFGLGDVGGS